MHKTYCLVSEISENACGDLMVTDVFDVTHMTAFHVHNQHDTHKPDQSNLRKAGHNSPIYDEYQTQSAKVLTLL